ncbi:probable aquaporin SIP2-1 [Sesamum indicum]|uniref:Probable aquaporin SIP2-1 n=1 Tax=Sesamum indicum TaxID=4182 RepID=A0A6I9TA80_SESIN|nr:probable aquaporin SIP2-1 [Sesamum indicum]
MKKMAGGWRLLAADFLMSFMWVWSSVLNKIFVHRILGYGAHEFEGEIVRYAVSLLNMFFFTFMCKAARGGHYNPLTLLSAAISGDFSNFLFVLGARIPTQVVGSIYGVRLILDTFPGIGRGPRLSVDIAKGALTEGLLTFTIVIISLGLSRKVIYSFFMNTWISSVSKLTLHILGSDLTGGCMNPASVMGWAFANGEHITKEHLIVYWLAPIEGTLAAVWVFRILAGPKEDKTIAAKKDDTPQLKTEKLN